MSNENQSDKALAAIKWPTVVVGLLMVHITIMLVAVAASLTIPAAVVAPDGYAKALAWDEQRQTESASRLLGWSLKVVAEPVTSPQGERQIEFFLADLSREPVIGADVNVRFYHPASPSDIQQETLQETQPGRYKSKLKMRRSGFWRLEVVAKRVGERFVDERDVWIGAGAPVAALPPLLKGAQQ